VREAIHAHEKTTVLGETVYVLAAIPEDLLEVLQEQKVNGAGFGGAISIANTSAWCNVLRLVGASSAASRISREIIGVVHNLGINVQTTTWGAINSPAKTRKWLPAEQINHMVADGIGSSDVIYTRGIDSAMVSAIRSTS